MTTLFFDLCCTPYFSYVSSVFFLFFLISFPAAGSSYSTPAVLLQYSCSIHSFCRQVSDNLGWIYFTKELGCLLFYISTFLGFKAWLKRLGDSIFFLLFGIDGIDGIDLMTFFLWRYHFPLYSLPLVCPDDMALFLSNVQYQCNYLCNRSVLTILANVNNDFDFVFLS